MSKSISTISENHLETWRAVASSAWDLNGQLKPLHSMNKLRTTLIIKGLSESGAVKNPGGSRPLEGLNILDIGCGAGILSEALAKLGANVTGIDPALENIRAAEAHKSTEMTIKYECTTVEEYLRDHPGAEFDATVASEVVEHVDHPELLVNSAAKLLKVGGTIFITTINKTFFAWIVVILLAEYIFRLGPIGTHPYDKFVSPVQMNNWLTQALVQPKYLNGQYYNALTDSWHLTSTTKVFWVMYGVREA